MSLNNLCSRISNPNTPHGTGAEQRASGKSYSEDASIGFSSDWTKRIGNAARTVFEAMKTGLKASQDYRRFAARVPSQQASKMVFQKYFSQ